MVFLHSRTVINSMENGLKTNKSRDLTRTQRRKTTAMMENGKTAKWLVKVNLPTRQEAYTREMLSKESVRAKEHTNTEMETSMKDSG